MISVRFVLLKGVEINWSHVTNVRTIIILNSIHAGKRTIMSLGVTLVITKNTDQHVQGT